jgi:hypothetical protein
MDRLPDEISQLQQRALLHAAGELSAEEVLAFEAEVAAGGDARVALEEARRLLVDTETRLGGLRQAEMVSERSMRRARDRATRSIFSWVDVERSDRVLRATRHSSLADGVVWRYARWPLAAAALLVVGLVLWTFSTEPAQNRDVADGTTPLQSAPIAGVPGGATTSPSNDEVRLDQIAALFDNPTRDEFGGVEFAGGLSDELAALRLLEEPDYE